MKLKSDFKKTEKSKKSVFQKQEKTAQPPRY